MGLSLTEAERTSERPPPPSAERVGSRYALRQGRLLLSRLQKRHRRSWQPRLSRRPLLEKARRPRDPLQGSRERRLRGTAFCSGSASEVVSGSKSGVGVRTWRWLSATRASSKAKSGGIISPTKATSFVFPIAGACAQRAHVG